MTMEKGPCRARFALNGRQLKIFGCACMFCFTLAASVLQNGVLGANRFGSAELLARVAADPNRTITAALSSALQLIGCLSIPAFAFLLVEGFRHTSNFRKYLLAVSICALVSEVPYDLAMSGRLWSPESQNAMFSCALCLLTLRALREFEGRGGALPRAMQFVILLAGLLWSGLLRCAFGAVMILLCGIYELLYARERARILLGCVVSAAYISAPLTGLALWRYGGARGAIQRKYLFYAFYPAHLLILGIAARLLTAAA